jgi:predicted PurR-regulated permease PerM
MSGNEASWDRIVRVILGIVLIYLGFSSAIEGGLGVFIGIIGFIPLITGIVGWCPIYAIFKTGTKKGTAS